jgi:hypothetical protein
MIYTISELSEQTSLAPGMLRTYLGHFSLSKYVRRLKKLTTHPCFTVDVTQEVITDFIDYLTLHKRKRYKYIRIEEIKHSLEELII